MTDSFFIFSGQDGLDVRRRNQDVQRVSRLAREMLAEITNLNCTQRHGRLHRRIVRYLNCEPAKLWAAQRALRSEEHTSELQSLMRISYAVFCLKKKTKLSHTHSQHSQTHTINLKMIPN